MALILEVVGADGARTWHRLGDAPLGLGRALTNDVILDDPYVDARHARIVLDASGALRLEDLGSVNGLVADGARLEGAVAVRPGVQVRIGRTTLRFRDTEEPVPPALVDAGDAPTARAAAAPSAAAAPRWIATVGGQLAIFLGALAVLALHAWLGNTARSGASPAFAAMMGGAFLTALWAGGWAVASRVSVHRFQFVGHLAVASVVFTAALAASAVVEWLSFAFPDAAAISVLSLAIMLGVVLALVVGHLALASRMPRRRRWRAGLAVAGVVLAVASLAALVDDDEFSDVPKFPAQLKPLAPEWLPTATVDEFGGALREIREEVDELAAEGPPAEPAKAAPAKAAR